MICAPPWEAETTGGGPKLIARAQPQLRIFARDHDTRIRFIADGLPVAVGRLAETAFFDHPEEAEAVARACAAYLESTPGSAADGEGWHALPSGARLSTFIPNLLWAARNRAWTASDPDPPALTQDPLEPAVEPPQSRRRGSADDGTDIGVGRPWARPRQARLCYLMGQGWGAKAIAADPEIHSTERAVYKQASRLGLSFAESPIGQINFRIPRSHLVVIDRAAAAAGQTRNAFMRAWTMRAVTKPDRFGLMMVPS